MKTYSAKPSDVTRSWYLIDASELPIGKISTEIAKLLMGKEKPQFTKHIDCGDYVVVINSDSIVATGNKMNDKMYYKHSNYPGGLTTIALKDQLTKDSTEIIYKAVRGMLPVNKLRAERLNRLKIYKDANHLQAPQNPKLLNLKETR